MMIQSMISAPQKSRSVNTQNFWVAEKGDFSSGQYEYSVGAGEAFPATSGLILSYDVRLTRLVVQTQGVSSVTVAVMGDGSEVERVSNVSGRQGLVDIPGGVLIPANTKINVKTISGDVLSNNGWVCLTIESYADLI